MARKTKQVDYENKYIEKLSFLDELYQERIAFLATFTLPGFENDKDEDKDSEGSGGGGDVKIGTKYDDIINEAGKKYGINPYFIASIIKQESNFDPNAGSGAGAQGLMQLMPATARALGCSNPKDPKQNVMAGTKYIKQMLEGQKWNPVLALAAYNAGPGNVSKYGGVPPFKETQHYVKVIPDNFKNYTGQKLTSKNVRWTGETISGGSGAKGDAKKVIDIAKSWLNKSNKYVFGGGRSQRDIDAGRFDCSSWVRYVFDKAGYNLGPIGNVSTETLKKKGKGVKKSELKPGDLVFFHTYKTNGHITIYLGNNKCIGTQSSTGVAIIDMTNSYWGPRLSNTLRRII